MNGQDFEQLTLFPADSPASPFLWPGSGEARKMTVTSGRRCCGLLKNSSPVGLLARMLLDLFERHLTKSFPALQKSGTKPGHTVQKLGMLEGCSEDRESPLWPRPTTGAPLCGGTGNFRQMERLRNAGIITEEERKSLTCGSGGSSNPALMEWLMGFPIGWTDLDA